MKKENKVGEKHITNEGYEVEIVEYLGSNNSTIVFNDERRTVIYQKRYKDLKQGSIKNPYHLSVFGVGYLGEGRHKTKINKKMTKMYYVWVDMLRRAYRSDKFGRDPSYVGVTVSEEWHNFQVFGDWFEANFNQLTDDVWHLDKDILVKGNRVYSEETCVFVPREINNLFIKSSKIRGVLPIGVNFNRSKQKFEAKASINGKHTHLGTFNTAEEAFQVYKVVKEGEIKKVADKWYNVIPKKVYQAMYNYQVEIAD